MTPENIHARIANRAPEMKLHRQTLSQIVSWSEQDTPITLEQYVATKLPETAQKIGINIPPVEGIVKDAHELDDEEIQKVSLARYTDDSDESILVKGSKSYTYDERIKGLQDRNELGVDLMRVSRQGIEFVQQLFKSGKVVGINEEPIDYKNPKIPPFEF